MQQRRFLTALPSRMAQLPLDQRGYPVPKFVKWFDGQPDFRVMDPDHLRRCVRNDRCWICGDQMGVHKTFVVGPMCAVNRISSEPPSHYDCAFFAVMNCPFLTRPLAKRADLSDHPEAHVAGIMIDRNPGVALLWITRTYKPFEANGTLFDLGEPERLEFYANGRRANRAEIDESVRTGLPIIEAAARKDGEPGLKEYAKAVNRYDGLMQRMGP